MKPSWLLKRRRTCLKNYYYEARLGAVEKVTGERGIDGDLERVELNLVDAKLDVTRAEFVP